MTTVQELSWDELFFGETHFYAEQDKPDIYALQWHEAGSTLYISIKGKDLVDIRMEREVHEVKYISYRDIGVENKAVVAFKILPHRPLLWAKGTHLEGGWGDRSQITVQILVDDSEAVKKYRRFCQWMVQNVFTGGAECLDRKASEEIWKYANRDFIELDEDIDVGEDVGVVDIKQTVMTRFKISLSLYDIHKALPGEWANDSIVEYGLRKKAQPGCHIMSPFSYSDMKKRGTKDTNKWVRNFDIFQCDSIIFPIHQNKHWCLAIIDQPGKLLVDGEVKASVNHSPGKSRSTSASSIDEKNVIDPDTMISKIYIMDSLPSGHPQDIFQVLNKFLMHEVIEKFQKTVDARRIQHIEVAVPTQDDNNDCGYFLMHFAHVFMEQPDKSREIIATQNGTLESGKHWNKDEANRKRAWVCNVFKDDMRDEVPPLDAHIHKEVENILDRLN